MTPVSDRDRNLLRQIEQGVIDGSVSTVSLLQKCIILGGRAGSTQLREWAAKELRGYGVDDELPPYRRVEAVLQIDAQVGYNMIRGQVIGPENLPREVQEAGIDNTIVLRQALRELEHYADDDSRTSIQFMHPAATRIVALMNAKAGFGEAVLRLYWDISRAAMRGVVDQVRTSLAELVAELVATLPHDTQTPSAQAADQAVNYIVSGKRNTVQVTNSQAASGSTSTISAPERTPEETWWTRWRKRGLIIGVATVVSAVAGVATWFGWAPW